MKAGGVGNVADKMGNTALMWASMADQWKCVSVLIEAGADVNKANNHGDVSLMCAARKGDEHWRSELIRAGADVNIVNKIKQTTFTNHEECVTTLLTAKGADLNMFEESSAIVECGVHIGSKIIEV